MITETVTWRKQLRKYFFFTPSYSANKFGIQKFFMAKDVQRSFLAKLIENRATFRCQSVLELIISITWYKADITKWFPLVLSRSTLQKNRTNVMLNLLFSRRDFPLPVNYFTVCAGRGDWLLGVTSYIPSLQTGIFAFLVGMYEKLFSCVWWRFILHQYFFNV